VGERDSSSEVWGKQPTQCPQDWRTMVTEMELVQASNSRELTKQLSFGWKGLPEK
jgi:hypothetical protein